MGLAQMPGTGLLPAVVPGAFDGWMLLLRDYGTLKLRDVLSYAISYAEHGFPLVPRIVAHDHSGGRLLPDRMAELGRGLARQRQAAASGQAVPHAGIAETYKRILAEAEAAGGDRIRQIEAARHAFYKGFVAEAIDRFYQTELIDSTGARHRGLLTGDDLARYAARVEPPLSVDYHGLTVHKLGPWSQGPMLLQTLRLLERIDIAAMDPLGPDFVHTLVEALKLGFADREVFYGDPDAVDVPLATLLSAGIRGRAPQADRRARLDGACGRATSAARRSACGACSRWPARKSRSAPGGGEPTFAPLPVEWGDTVHLDVVDAAGNMISATPSGGWLQGSPVVPGLGFPISTRGQMCWLEDGHPTTLRPRNAPAHHALADAGHARRRAVSRDRHARRRPAGAVDPHRVPAPRASPHEPAAGDRRADVPDQAHGAVVPSAPVRAGPRLMRRPLPGGNARRTGAARPSAHRRRSLGARAHLRGRPLGRLPARRRDAAADAGLRGWAIDRLLADQARPVRAIVLASGIS